MSHIRNSLRAHHEVMDALVAEALAAARGRRWGAYRQRFAELRRALVEHITYEDEELFPALARLVGEAEVAPLRSQHERLQQQHGNPQLERPGVDLLLDAQPVPEADLLDGEVAIDQVQLLTERDLVSAAAVQMRPQQLA